MPRCIAAALPLLAAACWSSSNKELERKVDTLAAELATSRAEVQGLQRRVGQITTEDHNTELQAKLEKLEKTLETLTTGTTPPPSSPPVPRPMRGPDPTKVYSVALGAAHVDGPPDAKVTLIIADEYACPYCERVRPTLVDLRKKYGKDLRIAYKQYVVHPKIATAPALAICAATKQKKHDKLDAILWDKGFRQRNYDQQTVLPDGSTQDCWLAVDGCPIVLGFAKEAGLNLGRFKQDMAGSCLTELADSMRELTALGVGATPSFYINGRHMSGAQPIENFAKLIDEEMTKADERIKQGTRRARYYEEWIVARGEKSLTP